MVETTWLKQAKAERGFTLIEFLIVVILIGILVAIVMPAYLRFAARAQDAAASANIRRLLPATSAYKADNDSNGGYAGMTISGPGGLKSYDDALIGWNATSGRGVTVLSKSAETYCIKSVNGSSTYYQNGPGQPIVSSPACA